ncbi:MAG TPA: trehalose-6-phosphate synthase [Thermoanaerobaculia bacterium]|nr:trehalose-6-phosphate synthase [Thermoanaerobaculia bacterium]
MSALRWIAASVPSIAAAIALHRWHGGRDGRAPARAPADLTAARLRKKVDRPSGGLERLERVGEEIGTTPLVVMANREPYVHERNGDGEIEVQRPAGGLVTALEPLLRQRGGTWIAYASGSADRETAKRDGTIAVPPDDPQYTLQRVFLRKEEVDRYYSGFANEALWPLCHIAHTRPVFRQADWQTYRAVNRRFARAASGEKASLIFVQDYHFALVPREIRNEAPEAVIGIFWHIPWPHAEMFAICPWKEELLDGLLGADVIGFHTDTYRRNFLDAASRFAGCEVNEAEMSITSRGHKTLLRTYPISIEWPYPAASREEGARLRERLGIGSDVHVSVGVDRADYTKGLVERLRAVETLLERNRELAGRYVHVQLAAPSRQDIGEYRDLVEEMRRETGRINARFGTRGWKPIVLNIESIAPDEVRRYYAMADSAVVTPLHDGMNLVAKEYVASCEDLRGALVLSRFAGAAAELTDALLVNPYDAVEVADAIQRAIDMPDAERASRMRALRGAVAGNTIYDWSANVLTDLTAIRNERATEWRRGELLRSRGA